MAPDSAGQLSYTVMMRTTDGGLNWNVLFDHGFVGNGFYRMVFRDTMVGVASGPNRMYRTQDGGLTWAVDSIRTDAPVMLPRTGANVGVGVGLSKWVYRFVTGPAASADAGDRRIGSIPTVRRAGTLLLIEPPPVEHSSVVVEIYTLLGQRRLHSVALADGKGYNVAVHSLPQGAFLLLEQTPFGTRVIPFILAGEPP